MKDKTKKMKMTTSLQLAAMLFSLLNLNNNYGPGSKKYHQYIVTILKVVSADPL